MATTFPEGPTVNDAKIFNLRQTPHYMLRPVQLVKSYNRVNLRPDLLAGLTVAVVMLPQAMAYALIAELPPQVGLYTAIVGSIVAALWGSSNHLQTGPTNAISLLVLSSLTLTTVATGTTDYLVAAGVMAVMVGIFQLGMGLARLGVLVNFVSHSVVVGFSAGAGVLIAIQQLPYLFGVSASGEGVIGIPLQEFVAPLPKINLPTLALGVGTILVIVLLRRFVPKFPGPLLSMILGAMIVYLFNLQSVGVSVIGEMPIGLPPLSIPPFLNLELINQLAMGALAVAAIGLVESISISRSIASQTDQRLNSNQEFVGQGLANIASGFFSGYACSGSFTRSAVNFKAGGQTPFSSVFSGVFVLIAMLVMGPLAAYLPRAALAGVLIVTAYGMIDSAEIRRIWQGARGDAVIMLATFLSTLLLPLEFAVLIGILLSFAVFIVKTSVPRVFSVVPDAEFKHFIEQQGEHPSCPQLGILKISGDLYFGAVSHIEEAIHHHLDSHPEQRFLLLRMHGVNQCDFSGIHMLEAVMRLCRERNGDLYLMKVQDSVLALMQTTGFFDRLGTDHFLPEEFAIEFLFQKVLDPAICIYECNVRVFKECQNLPKQTYSGELPLHTDIPAGAVAGISPQALWRELYNGGAPPLVVDVRETREFQRGHIPNARLIPLPTLLADTSGLPDDKQVVLVCRGGRRSTRATYWLQNKGYRHVRVLQGGMLAWESAGLLEAIE
jgi:SulP family sulfate permease